MDICNPTGMLQMVKLIEDTYSLKTDYINENI